MDAGSGFSALASRKSLEVSSVRLTERRCNVPSTDESRGRQSMTPQPLADSEFDGLGDVLKRFGGKQAMNLEQLDGFLAALICYPSDIPKAEYLPEIWGDEMINDDAFAAQPVLQEFLSLVARHKDAVAHILQSGDVFTPVLLANTDGVFLGNDWANGFLRGMEIEKGGLVCALQRREPRWFTRPNLCLGTRTRSRFRDASI